MVTGAGVEEEESDWVEGGLAAARLRILERQGRIEEYLNQR